MSVCMKIFLVFSIKLCRPPVGWGSTYSFTDVRVSIGIHVTPITEGTPSHIFLGGIFCSLLHWLLIFAMTLTFALKVKL